MGPQVDNRQDRQEQGPADAEDAAVRAHVDPFRLLARTRTRPPPPNPSPLHTAHCQRTRRVAAARGVRLIVRPIGSCRVPFVPLLQGRNRTWYAGAYTLINTHEIAVMSGLAAADRLVRRRNKRPVLPGTTVDAHALVPPRRALRIRLATTRWQSRSTRRTSLSPMDSGRATRSRKLRGRRRRVTGDQRGDGKRRQHPSSAALWLRATESLE